MSPEQLVVGQRARHDDEDPFAHEVTAWAPPEASPQGPPASARAPGPPGPPSAARRPSPLPPRLPSAGPCPAMGLPIAPGGPAHRGHRIAHSPLEPPMPPMGPPAAGPHRGCLAACVGACVWRIRTGSPGRRRGWGSSSGRRRRCTSDSIAACRCTRSLRIGRHRPGTELRTYSSRRRTRQDVDSTEVDPPHANTAAPPNAAMNDHFDFVTSVN